jgi:SAM-dependent methyltransferase
VSEWWESFFLSSWQDVQIGWWSEEGTAEQVDGIVRPLGLEQPCRVLDVPCGEGRVSIELASRGHRVTGVDITERFLEEARRRAGDREVEVAFERRDMRDLPWVGEFDAVVNVWGSFGYFEGDGDERFVHAASRALEPGGRFLIDTHVAESVLPHFTEREWSERDAGLLLERRRWDPATGRIETDWTFVRDGGTETHRSSIRIYTFRELTQLLSAAGFVAFQGFDPDTLEPFELGASHLMLVATKAD